MKKILILLLLFSCISVYGENDGIINKFENSKKEAKKLIIQQ